MRAWILVALAILPTLGCAGREAPVMSLDERKALECKGHLQQLCGPLAGWKQPEGGPSAADLLKSSLGGVMSKCPAARTDTYSASVRKACEGDAPLVVACEGENHVLAGYAKDYPRWTAEHGLVDDAEGTRLPLSFELPLPKDANLKATYARQGTCHLTFTTDESLEQWAENYNELLNPGTEFVNVSRNGALSASGNLNGIVHQVTFRLEERQVEVAWDPITGPARP